MAPCDGSSSVMAVDRATTFNVDAFFTSEAFTGAVGLPPRKRYTVPAAFADHPAAGRARLAVSPDAAWSVRVAPAVRGSSGPPGAGATRLELRTTTVKARCRPEVGVRMESERPGSGWSAAPAGRTHARTT